MPQIQYTITINCNFRAFLYAQKILTSWLNLINEQCAPQKGSQHVHIYITDQLNRPQTEEQQYLHVRVREANMHPLHILALSGHLKVFGQNKSQPFFPKYLVEMTVANSIAIAVMLAINKHSLNKTIQLSCIECVRYFGAFNTLSAEMGLIDPENLRGGSVLDGGLPSYKLFQCKGGSMLAVGSIEGKFYQPMICALNLSQQDQEFCLENQLNKEEWSRVNTILKSKLRTQTAEHWEHVMADRDTCVTAVRSIGTADPAFLHPRLLTPKM